MKLKFTPASFLTVTALAIVLDSPSANAAITVTETGDWSGNLGSPHVIASPLGIGTNTIRGSLPVESFPFADFADTDVFSISNPAGLLITTITFEITGFFASSGSTGRLEILLPNSGSEFYDSNGTFTLTNLSVVNTSELQFRINGPVNFLADEAGSSNYNISINAIPELSTSALFAGAGIVASFVRRRHV